MLTDFPFDNRKIFPRNQIPWSQSGNCLKKWITTCKFVQIRCKFSTSNNSQSPLDSSGNYLFFLIESNITQSFSRVYRTHSLCILFSVRKRVEFFIFRFLCFGRQKIVCISNCSVLVGIFFRIANLVEFYGLTWNVQHVQKIIKINLKKIKFSLKKL